MMVVMNTRGASLLLSSPFPFLSGVVTLVPSLDHLAETNLELEWLIALLRRIKDGTIEETTGVVN